MDKWVLTITLKHLNQIKSLLMHFGLQKFTIVSVITINFFAFTIAIILTRGKKALIFPNSIFMPNLIGALYRYIWQLIINGILYKMQIT